MHNSRLKTIIYYQPCILVVHQPRLNECETNIPVVGPTNLTIAVQLQPTLHEVTSLLYIYGPMSTKQSTMMMDNLLVRGINEEKTVKKSQTLDIWCQPPRFMISSMDIGVLCDKLGSLSIVGRMVSSAACVRIFVNNDVTPARTVILLVSNFRSSLCLRNVAGSLVFRRFRGRQWLRSLLLLSMRQWV